MTVEVNSVGSIKEEIVVNKPIVVLWRVLAKNGVETMLIREERYPTLPSPVTVDWREEPSCVEEIYPACPNPTTVDRKELSRKGVDTTLIKEER